MHTNHKHFISPIVLIILMASSLNAWSEGTLRERLRKKHEARKEISQAEQKDEKKQDIAQLKAGDYTFSLQHQHQHQTRQYLVHIPKNYNQNQATPLVLSLHGGGGNMEYQANEDYYHLISKSDQAGFIAVFPNGNSQLRSGKFATWNAGICCGKARDEQSDDVGFIKMVIADIKTKANIDPKRIYANGMSNGGMMSYRLACELADTFTAIAAVAATDGTKNCTPSKPVSILHIHALDDDHVLFNGGSGVKSETHADFVSVPNTISKWVKQNACNLTPERVLQVKGAYCDLYSACQNNTQVKLCVTETGGHAWPGGNKVRGGAGSTAFNANDLIWDFYQTNTKIE
jgi:polyhydroxybutyrate depolymerase